MSTYIHSVDLFWACLSIAAGVYPAIRLSEHLHRRSTRDFFSICLILASYPTLLAIFHLTPFDLGLVYSSTVFLPVLYFLAMVRYLEIQLPGYNYWRQSLLATGCALSVLALTNQWHGQFATFAQANIGEPNHLLDDIAPGIGMGLMHALAALTVVATMIIACVQYLRAQAYPTQMLLGIVLPGLALWSFTATERAPWLAQWQISGFILCTTIVLLLANYALARNHFIELRVVTRSRMLAMLPDAMVMISGSGKIVDFNAAFLSLVKATQVYPTDPLAHDQAMTPSLKGVDLIRCLPTVGCVLATQPDEDFETSIEIAGPIDSNCVQPNDSRTQARHYQGSTTRLGKHKDSACQRLLVLRDVTAQFQLTQALQEKELELERANARLLRLSNTDALTGLQNRRFFQDRLAAELERWDRDAGQFGVLLMDLDFFKQVNDSYGHQAGDQVLVQVARLLEAHCRSADVLARVGGEEFSVLLLDADNQSMNTAAERFRAAIANQPLRLDNGTAISATISIGGALVEPQDSMRQLLERADKALYRAKAAGRNQTIAL